MSDKHGAGVLTAGQTEEVTSEGLHRALKNRHIQMIAIGGAIGTGLFYGSAGSISMAGPAILFAYVVGGLVIWLVMRACGEMSVEEPVSGAFAHYAQKYWGNLPGFYSGWNYWFNYVAVSMAELTVVGIYVNFWFPSVPQWVSAAGFLVLVTAINLVNVKAYGEFEFWFAIIKVVAIVAMILLGLVIVFVGVSGHPAVGLENLTAHGGFFPKGVTGLVSALAVVMFAFGGVELIAITAGEADNPTKTIPKAIDQVIYRIFIFYVGAIFVILCMFPWDRLGNENSPFVTIFDKIGIPGAAHILNIVVLTAAVSAYNSGLYSNGRMLYTLAREGNAPKLLGKLSKSGSPVVGVLVSSAVTAIAVLVIFFFTNAFAYVMAIALFAAITNWSMMTYTQLKWRRLLSPTQVAGLRFKMPLYPVTNWLVLVFFLGILALMGTQEEFRVALVIGPLWMAGLVAAFFVKRAVTGDGRPAFRDPREPVVLDHPDVHPVPLV